VEHHQQTYWQVWTPVSSVPRLGKLHRLATREERGKKDRVPRVHQARKQLSDLRKFPKLEGHSISEPIRQEELPELPFPLRRLKPGKSPRLDSIFPEFILHAGSALKSWFCDFLTSCMRQLKIPKIWRRAPIVLILNPEKPLGTQRGAGGLSTREVDRRPGHPADIGHR